MPVVKVNVVGNRDVINKYNINGYPDLRFFRNQIPLQYVNLDKKAQTLQEWINNMKKPISTPIETYAELEALIDKGNMMFLYLYKKKDDKMWEMFTRTAGQYSDVPFYHSQNSEIIQKKKVPFDHSLIMFNPAENLTKIFPLYEKITIYQILEFIENRIHRNVEKLDYKVHDRIFRTQQTTLLCFTKSYDSQKARQFLKFAEKHQNDGVLFVLSQRKDAIQKSFAKLLQVPKKHSVYRMVKFENGSFLKFRPNRK